MENESRLKRLGSSAAATVVAAAIWIPSPVGELLFFPRDQRVEYKIMFVVFFLIAMCALLFLFGRFARKNNIISMLFVSAVARLLSSVIILMSWVAYFRCVTGIGREFSSVKEITDLIIIYFGVSSIKGTFAFAAFTAVVYRYLPNAIGWLSRFRSGE